ncbi:MAG: S-methyl-5'-thioadenosine phosphorylase [Planctomycetota bacterium]|nr:S-methyl-5'-thioadenosine phosphorylase [Planctomycetota bacterium]
MSELPTAEIGILGGTGVYTMDGLEEAEDVIIETPYGMPSSSIRVGTLDGRRVAFIARHGPGHRLLPTEVPYRANVYALKRLGVTKALSAGAVGSLQEFLPPRTLVVPDQFFDRTRHRPDTFFGDGLVAHVSMADPFAPALRAVLLEAAAQVGHAARDGGTYVCMEGPQFSSRAESLFYRGLGAAIIGMTTLSEARLCREAEIAFAALSMVTDYDCWRPEEEGVDAAEILAVLKDNADLAQRVLRTAIALVPTGPLPENDVLSRALVTRLDAVPEETLARLEAILAAHR